MKHIIKLVSVIIPTTMMLVVALSTGVLANKNSIPEPFRGQDNKSIISISYDDYSEILKASVLDMGPSNRAKAPKTSAKIGSRFKSKRKAYTAMEGNRFLFENFKNKDNKAILTTIRKSLEKVPDEVAMSQLNPREQLAFWLNLYNISLIEQLMDVYPKKNIEDELYDRNGILNKKFLKISGIDLSLNDIHYKIILGKFSANPIVIYGLYQGIIGGPNIRTSAYTGKLVIKQLRHNASEFINSNRGTFKGKKDILKVSSFYDRNRGFFPDFDVDLRKHIAYYLDSKYAHHLENSKRLRTEIKDMSIADLSGGERKFSSSAATNEAAFLDSVSAYSPLNSTEETGHATQNTSALSSRLAIDFAKDFGRYSQDTVEMLVRMKAKNNLNKGKVIITDESEEKLESEQ